MEKQKDLDDELVGRFTCPDNQRALLTDTFGLIEKIDQSNLNH
jgi:hypothetical protein